MALPTKAVVTDAIDTLLEIPFNDMTVLRARTLRSKIIDLASRIEVFDATYDDMFTEASWTQDMFNTYGFNFEIALVDGVDASPTAFRTSGGAGYAAYGDADIPVGTKFKVTSDTADFTDNSLATAKGGAVAAGDIYKIATSSTVSFLANVG